MNRYGDLRFRLGNAQVALLEASPQRGLHAQSMGQFLFSPVRVRPERIARFLAWRFSMMIATAGDHAPMLPFTLYLLHGGVFLPGNLIESKTTAASEVRML